MGGFGFFLQSLEHIFGDANFIDSFIQVKNYVGRFEELFIIRKTMCVPKFSGLFFTRKGFRQWINNFLFVWHNSLVRLCPYHVPKSV